MMKMSRRVRSFFGAAMIVACAAAGSLLVQLGEHPDPAAAHELAWARQHLHGARLARFFKGDDPKAGFRSVVGNRGEGDRGQGSVEEERYALRAYPLDEIPFAYTQNARASFDKLRLRSNRGNRTAGTWQLLGPEYAIEPAILSFSGVAYVASGRVTAMAIGPTCTPSQCRLWVGAAGGGIWRTDDALAGSPHWARQSNGLTSNAIGVLVRTRDPSGNTLYAGTGEGNASADSAAGTGVFRTTDGGETWTLLPGSTLFCTAGRSVRSCSTRRTRTSSTSASPAACAASPRCPAARPPILRWRRPSASTSRPTAAPASAWSGTAAGSIRGVSDAELDPRDPETIYAAAFQVGIWRSSPRLDGTANFLQVFAPARPPRTPTAPSSRSRSRTARPASTPATARSDRPAASTAPSGGSTTPTCRPRPCSRPRPAPAAGRT